MTVSIAYNIPRNLPQSSVRNYRFPLRGTRQSARLNFLLHAIYGDLKLVKTSIESIEDYRDYYLGVLMMTNAFEYIMGS